MNIFGRSPCSILLFLVHLNFKECLEFLFNLPLTTTFRKESIGNDKTQRGEDKKEGEENSQLQIYHYCQIVTAFKMNKD